MDMKNNVYIISSLRNSTFLNLQMCQIEHEPVYYYFRTQDSKEKKLIIPVRIDSGQHVHK